MSALYDVENTLFEQACRRAMSLELDGVDHQGAIKRCFVCQLGEYVIENTDPAPPDEAIVQRFAGAVRIRCILPLKCVFDDVDDAADDTPVIHTGSTVRTGKERFETQSFRLGKLLLISRGTKHLASC